MLDTSQLKSCPTREGDWGQVIIAHECHDARARSIHHGREKPTPTRTLHLPSRSAPTSSAPVPSLKASFLKPSEMALQCVDRVDIALEMKQMGRSVCTGQGGHLGCVSVSGATSTIFIPHCKTIDPKIMYYVSIL